MTTNEFIKLLREADPEGNTHLRFPDTGEPYFGEPKAGYWDGPYMYLDKETGKWVYTTEGSKIDIHFTEPSDVVDEILQKWNPYQESDEGVWEKVLDRFEFRLTYSIAERRRERIDNFLKPIREHFDYMLEYYKKSSKRELETVIELYQSGCRFFRLKDVKLKYYEGWEFLDGNEPRKGVYANLATTGPILNSGKFESVPCTEPGMEDYFEYKLVS